MRLTEADKKLAKLWPWEPKVGDVAACHSELKSDDWGVGVIMDVPEEGSHHDTTGQLAWNAGLTIQVAQNRCIPLRSSDQIFERAEELGLFGEVSCAWYLGPSYDSFHHARLATLADTVYVGEGDSVREALAAALVKVLEGKK